MAASPQLSFSIRGARRLVGRVNRAALAFREGLPVTITGGEVILRAFAVETVSEEALADVKGGVLLLTHARARTLKIPVYTPEVVALPLEDMTPERLHALADPTLDLSAPLKGPFRPSRDTVPDGAPESIKLAKIAGLLPATVALQVPADREEAVTLSINDVSGFERAVVATLEIVTRAHVPLEGAERTELVAFRSRDGGPEHYAILIGAPAPHDAVLTRLHSECFTGDLLGSLKCDCGPQLRGALETIAKAGGGVLLYLAQEGRGIGLVNKLRAYRLQDQGFDTHRANERLGFEPDERLYPVAARMLSLLGYSSLRLLTNNPKKVKALEEAGFTVERVPHRFAPNKHNRNYLESKAEAGHLL